MTISGSRRTGVDSEAETRRACSLFFQDPHRSITIIADRKPERRTKNNCAETGNAILAVDDTLARKLQRREVELRGMRDRLKHK